MATGFKTATVRSGDVPATQTDFPTYVDLSRLGITTLAEAQSVRVYAEVGKSTEWSREIVSVTEMHVKVPSLTSSTEIFVDWDGVRSDYGVTTTYGAEAVWSDYFAVWHFQGAAGTTVKVYDSSGNGRNWTEANSPTTADGVQGQTDGSYDMTGSAGATGSSSFDYLSMGTVMGNIGSNPFTMSVWFKPHIEHSTTVALFREEDNGPTGRKNFGLWLDPNEKISAGYAPNGTNSYNVGATANAVTVNAWSYGVFRRLVSSLYPAVTLNGGTTVIGTTGGGTFSSGNNSFFLNRRYNSRYSSSSRYMDGQYGEMRMRFDDVGESWITTEYNNQNAEATFWGTWTTAGGAAQAARRGAVMMM